ncbi:MAG: TetR family transcriptional regulator [Bacteroidetes bacterium]|nr:MAG: TetR family transcriptional regulator [Bacteroidota bacterium]
MRKENTSLDIVHAAKSVFARFGFKKTSMDMIARSIGKGKSSIYYYFKSKEDIFQAVVEQEAIELKNEIYHAVNSVELPRQKLKTYILTRLKTLEKMDNLSNALRGDYLSNLHFINQVKARYRAEEMEMVSEILLYGQQRGKFEFENVREVAKPIVLAISGLEMEYFINPMKEDMNEMERNLDLLLDVFFKGLSKS